MPNTQRSPYASPDDYEELDGHSGRRRHASDSFRPAKLIQDGHDNSSTDQSKKDSEEHKAG